MEFKSYADSELWIEAKSKEYGGKNKFLASQEYRDAYPAIQALHRGRTQEFGQKASEAMREVGALYGDRVHYDAVSPFGQVEAFSGIIVERKGLPYVKLDEPTSEGRRSVHWHKGWLKTISQAKPMRSSSLPRRRF